MNTDQAPSAADAGRLETPVRPRAWLGPAGQLMIDGIYDAWAQNYPDEARHFLPLYDHAMEMRKPLAAQQLDKLIEAHVGGAELTDGEYSAMVMFAAAVERAHGIGA